ncbi:hypothetical protein H4582DRAFT_2214861 [Lactarius indigo]|nr:hypothetical protein H4582DRAFT_2214861 [Lactarius indigo]
MVSLLAGKPNAALFPLTGVQFAAPRVDGGSGTEDVELKVDDEVLAMGLQYAPTGRVVDGVPRARPQAEAARGRMEETLEEWRALKADVGIGCKVIDRALEDIAAISAPTSQWQKCSRFYNIYNSTATAWLADWRGAGIASHALLGVGASVVVFFATSSFIMMPRQYVLPGGPTYYDRAAWSSFNTMHATGEGFPGEGTTAVWNFLGRVGGGAAHIARGWPT